MCASRMRAGTLAMHKMILLLQVSCQIWYRMFNSNSNILRDVLKADTSLGNFGASKCWTRQMKDAIGDLQNDALKK